MAHQIQDDGFHEIQLNGKQLVFLFMAATVVSVVIFLCGVLVGRGVRGERIPDSAQIASVADPAPAPPPVTTTPPPAGSDPTAAAPPASDELSYFSRLEKANTPQEKLKPPSEQKATPPRETAATAGKAAAAATKPDARPAKPETPPAKAEAPPAKAETRTAKAAAPEKAAPPPEKPASAPEKVGSTRPEPPQPVKEPLPAPKEPERPAPADAPPAAPSGDGFAVQIAALNVRSEADAIARRLTSKGYTAYVVTPANGTPAVYRVRVGKFPTKREAESVAARLQREEQFKPWVTR